MFLYTSLALLPVAFFFQNSSLDFHGFLPSEHPGRYNRERDREPYFERQGNSNTDHRDFKRERELHRDRGSWTMNERDLKKSGIPEMIGM